MDSLKFKSSCICRSQMAFFSDSGHLQDHKSSSSCDEVGLRDLTYKVTKVPKSFLLCHLKI